VCFIENHGLGSRQQVAEAALLEREIGEQQVVIDDDDVSRLRLATRGEHMAGRKLRTLGAETVLARGGHGRPDRMSLGHLRELAHVARDRPQRPGFDA
jgi:hypothetical protein